MMFRFLINGRRGTVDTGVVTMDEDSPVDRMMGEALQDEIDFRRRHEADYYFGIDALAIDALKRWDAKIIERTPPPPQDPDIIY